MRSQFLNAWYAITKGNATNFNRKHSITKARKTRRSRQNGRKTRRLRRNY